MQLLQHNIKSVYTIEVSLFLFYCSLYIFQERIVIILINLIENFCRPHSRLFYYRYRSDRFMSKTFAIPY